ncbi:ATP-binding cassette sub-family A member 1 [Biomphalaria glabrata]|uniref:Phospholipid-transporting ATPase ABCA1-like n=1 Tax=Biomphalaria glabrata TaxID=6526 RepID=A0A9W2ZR35_BIOGL|nr:phospholipid-transporting ATPase ABCA1-like [Biomphalaria glabrata]
MQSLNQLRLLVWKNILLRRRYPLFLALELLWPVLILGIVSVLRIGSPPIKTPECHYQKWSMPSAGLVPFLQSLVCNIDNYCFTNQESIEASKQSARSFSALTQDVLPLISSNDILDILQISNKSIGLLNLFKNVIKEQKFIFGLGEQLYIKYYIRNETEFKNILVNKYQILTLGEFNDIMMSKLNIGKLLNMTEIPDLKSVLCSSEQLGSFFIFPAGTDVKNISIVLCDLELQNNTELINEVLQHLNLSSLIRAIKLIEEIKEKTGSKDNVTFALENVAQMYDIVRNEETLLRAIQALFSIPKLDDLFSVIPYIMENSSALGSMIDLIRKLVFSLNPIMVSLKMDNSTLWGILQDIALLGDYLTTIGDGSWNRSSADLVLPLGDLLYKLNQLSSDSSSAVAINLLKIFADFDWVTLFTELFGTSVAPTSSTNILIDSLIQVLLKGPDLTKALTQAIINKNYTEFTLLVTKVFLGFGLNGTVDPLFLNPIRNLIVAVQSLTNALQNTTSPLPLFVTSVITQLNSALNVIGLSISTICNIVIRSFGQTDPNTYLPLYVTIESIDIMSGLVKIIPELDDLMCILFDKTGLNLNVFWDTLTKIGFWNDLNKIVTRLSNPSQSLNCSKPVEDMIVITSSISSSFTNDGLNISRMIQCFSLSQEQIQNLLSSFSNYLVLIKNLLNLLQKPAIQKLLTDPDILPLFDLTLEIVIYNSKAMLTVSNLLKSDKNVAQYLLNSGISQLVVETFMNAAVNSNQAYFLQQTSLDITNILCDPDQLSKVMTPSVTASVSLNSLSNAFCNTTLQAAVLAEYLKNSSLSSSGINDLLTSASQFSGMLISLLPSLKDLVSGFSDVTTFFIASVIDTNINILEENIDVLDKIIGSNTMSELSKQLQKLLTPLISLFPPKYKSVTVLTSVQTIVNGLVNVDFLKGYLLPEIQVKSLLKYPMNTTNYFTSVLGITQNVAQEILNAVFSSGILQGIANYSSYTCNEVLKRLVFVNATKATLQNVQTEICALNTSQVVKLLNVLIPELDISALISKYTSTLVDTILQDTNITSTELTELAYKINQGLVSSIKTYQMLNQSESKMEIIQSFSAALTSDMPLVDKISQSVCGRIISPDLAAFPSVSGITVSTDTLNLNGAQNKSVDNDLQGTFCQDFFKTINDLEFGSILWNYLKPILLGKILYTPDNEITRTILSKANKTFALVGELNRIATVWANQAVNLQGLLDFIKDTSLLKDLLNNEVIQDILRATTGIQPDLLLTSLPTLENTTFSNDILETLQSVAAMVANYTSCILADRFQPVSNETELENMAFKLAKSKIFFAGIVFYDVLNESETSARQKRQVNSNTIPKHIGYKIRMDIDSVMDTSLLKERTFTMNAEDNLIENLRYLRGFIFLQDLLDSRIIELHKNQSLTNPAVNLIQMPFPCHHADSFIFLLGTYLVPIMMCFVYLSILGVATYNLVYDRENGQDEVLRVMGMIKGVNVLAWFLSTMFMMLTVAIIMAVMLKYTNIFIYSNLFIMFLLLACFSLSSLMLMYMVSALFNRTSMALLFVIILYLLSYLPFTILIGYDFTLNFWQRILTCFACTTSLCFATLKIAFLEEQGIGVQWSNIDRAGPDELSVAWSFYMMLIDSVIYFLVGWYIQELKPGKYGVGQPFYFPFQLSYWKSFCKYKLPTRERIDRKAHTASSLFEAPPEGVNVGISVENISKIYYNKKVLDQLNLQFYENQITSLLGQNGAAKTTTIKIICGLLKPTSGYVYFNRNFSLVGICPQHNSIFNYMTVREHMEFYSEIKNIKNKKMSFLEIQRLLKEVDLWHARNVPAKNLSYGMKRRLCVALAFVGNTKKIILDEPTSGIDPHTRKHIWNLVTRNRIGRTIVLSTHHLDEADFLSDRIAVMHQGKLLCCGSPSFLKQSIGSGYHLTIMKIDQRNQSHSQEINELRSRSSTAAITTFIQSLCSNATLEEQAGSDLIYNLPKDHSLIVPIDEFFRRLDQSVNHLNIASYGLSDTSLEEIFLKLTKSADQNLSNDTPSNRTYVPNSQSSITSSESENSRTDLMKTDL